MVHSGRKDVSTQEQVGMCRNELQQAKMYSQAGQPQSDQGLRQSLERELQQQVTQLEVSTNVLEFRLLLLMGCLFSRMTVESHCHIPTCFLEAETKMLLIQHAPA
jgi:hypothetical protein